MADEDVSEPDSEPDLDLDIDPADDSSAVMAAVGRQIRLRRKPLTMLTFDPKEIRILEQRLGLVRAQGLTPRESRTFIEKVLGET